MWTVTGGVTLAKATGMKTEQQDRRDSDDKWYRETRLEHVTANEKPLVH